MSAILRTIAISALLACLIPVAAVRAQVPTTNSTSEPTAASICLPGAGEIGLQGTVQKLSANSVSSASKGRLTLSVTLIRTSDGKKTPLAAPRIKEIDIAPGASVFRVMGTGKDETVGIAPTDAEAIAELLSGGGVTVVCLGANGGEGTTLLARSLVIFRDTVSGARMQIVPGKNLLPPLTEKDSWWVIPIGGKAKADSAVEDEDTLKVTISAVDDLDWHVLFTPTKHISLVSGAAYRLSFLVRADQKHVCVIQSQVGQGDFHNTGLFQRVMATPDWQTFHLVFTAHDTLAGQDSCPSFALGQQVGAVYFKDMKLEAIGTQDIPGNLIRPATDPEGWSILLAHSAEASLARENNSLRVTVAKVAKDGGSNADVRVVQYNVPVSDNQWYTLRFRARSPIARPLRVESAMAQQPALNFGLERTVTIGPVEKTYVLTFQARNPQGWPNDLTFLVGDAVGTLWLSDVTFAPGKAVEQL